MTEKHFPPSAYQTVPVDLGERSYEIHVGRGVLKLLPDWVKLHFGKAKLALISDEIVFAHYGKIVVEMLEQANFHVHNIVLPAGEKSKSFEMLEEVTRELVRAGMERQDLVLALGGGVIGDLAGFSAAITLRGLSFVQIPTSLLAQVDSSVGGKTGINIAEGKNLVGAFYQPRLVLSDTAILDSLDERQFRSGFAEVIKYGLINDPAFFFWLQKNWKQVFLGGSERNDAVVRSCQAKAKIVSEDEKENQSRALLNLGHSFGHALEALTGYSNQLLHGEAVAIGIAMAFRFSKELGLCNQSDVELVETTLKDVGLAFHGRHLLTTKGEVLRPVEMIEVMKKDKKVKHGRMVFILARGIGKSFVSPDVKEEDLLNFLSKDLA